MQMYKCNVCGAVFEDPAELPMEKDTGYIPEACPRCGEVDSFDEVTVCKACGEIVENDCYDFCDSCFKKLKDNLEVAKFDIGLSSEALAEMVEQFYEREDV